MATPGQILPGEFIGAIEIVLREHGDGVGQDGRENIAIELAVGDDECERVSRLTFGAKLRSERRDQPVLRRQIHDATPAENSSPYNVPSTGQFPGEWQG
jgi:hypothetical protein